jgi:uncharacterized protein (DUF2141 family)
MRQHLALILATLCGSVVVAQAADLTVIIEGMHTSDGDVLVGVYGKAEDWPDGKTVAEGKAKAAPTVRFTFTDLPPGPYAVSAFHDENGNGKFDTNEVGFPLEGFAFSNDVHPFLSAPMFEAAAFDLDAKGTTVTLHMQYWHQHL